jgi:hypothetical protein
MQKMSQSARYSSVLVKVTIQALLAIAVLICTSSVQVSIAGTKLRNDWNKSLVGKPCTTSNGRTGVWTPNCTYRKVPWGPTSTCLHMTIVCE